MGDNTARMYTIQMKYKFKMGRSLKQKYFGIREFFEKYPNEDTCEKAILDSKYPDGFKCRHCEHDKFHRLKDENSKRRRLIICSKCKKQESITKETMFYGSKQSLHNWFLAIFYMTQTKKGISAYQLSKHLKIAHSSAILMMNKIRFQMTEDAIKYQIGGPEGIVLADEFEMGRKKETKQDVLALLEKKSGKLGRVRFTLLEDRKLQTIEKVLICQVAKGTTLHTDGKKGNIKLSNRNYNRIVQVVQVSHAEENYTYKFLEELDMIIGNLKTWYRAP